MITIQRTTAPHAMSRLGAVGLGALIFLGAQVMWLGIPAAWLWLGSQTKASYLTVYGVALVGAPPTMAVWGWLLHRLNNIYLHTISALAPRRRHSAWLKPLSGESPWKSPSALLEFSVTAAFVTAIVVLLVVFLVVPEYLVPYN